jgi:phosphoglycolate phosphatase
MPSPRLVLFFDLDGTLADSCAGIVASLEYAFQSCGIAPPPIDWREFVGPPLPRMLAEAMPDLFAKQRDAVITAFRGHYSSHGLFSTRIYPGVGDLVGRLAAAGHALYVLTNKPQEPADRVLTHLGIGSHFAEVFGSDPLAVATKADRAAAIVSQLGVIPNAVIGDGLDDLAAAERLGTLFFLANWGYGASRVRKSREDVHVLDRPEDVLQMT